MHIIAAKAVAFKEALAPSLRLSAANHQKCGVLADALLKRLRSGSEEPTIISCCDLRPSM
jgi:glycine/serine hydroxymethyltransferase